MIKKIKTSIIALVSLFALATPVLVPAVAMAGDINQGVCAGVTAASGATCDIGADDNTGVNNLITRIVNLFSLIVGVLAVIFIVYGGARYIASGGDSGKITSAKNTIVYAIIGLVVVALAQFIVRFVLARASTADV